MKPPIHRMLLSIAYAETAVVLAHLSYWCAARAFPRTPSHLGDLQGQGRDSRWWRCGAWLLRCSASCMHAAHRHMPCSAPESGKDNA